MSLPKYSLICLGLVIAMPAFAEPALHLEADYTQFRLEHQFNESQNRGGLFVTHKQDSFESGHAFRLGAEMAWSVGDHIEWMAAASATYSGQAKQEPEITAITPGWTIVAPVQPLDEMYLLGLRSGLRWQQDLTQKLRFHADMAASINQWRYTYSSTMIDIVIDSSSASGTRFVLRDVTYKDDDRYLALEAVAGMYYSVTPTLDFALQGSGQLGSDYRNRQFNAGLRYTFR